jgi:hypothetical protein
LSCLIRSTRLKKFHAIREKWACDCPERAVVSRCRWGRAATLPAKTGELYISRKLISISLAWAQFILQSGSYFTNKEVTKMKNNALISLLLLVFTPAIAGAELRTFDLEWSGAGSGNAAVATGTITIDDTLLNNPGFSNDDFVTDFSITVEGSGSGDGGWGRSDFATIFMFTDTALDLSMELIGQPTSINPWGTQDPADTGGDFNFFAGTAGAPTGTYYFQITTSSGLNLRLVSFRPVDAPVPRPQRGVVQSIHVGGPDACATFGLAPGCDGNFSLNARKYADGAVRGQWTDRFGNGTGMTAEIDCLHVEGNEAWVSGYVKATNNPRFFIGQAVTTRVQDNGTSANDLPDASSFTIRFDAPCTDARQDFPLFAYPQGQVTIQN